MTITAYPDGHIDSKYDEETELNFLKEKVDAGADFIITQLFYDVDGFLKWLTRVRERGTQISLDKAVYSFIQLARHAQLQVNCWEVNATHDEPLNKV